MFEQSLHSNSTEKMLSRSRVLILLLFVLLLTGIVIARYYHLQITLNANYLTLSDQNRVYGRSIAPLRGLVKDRNGVVLARNVPSFELNIIPEHSEDTQLLIEQIAGLIDLSEQEIEVFNQRKDSNLHRSYQSIPLKFRLTEEEIAKLAVNEYRLPGMEIKTTPARDYPFAEVIAHALGYVGRINVQEQDLINKQRYEGIHLIGKIGIEKQYENKLVGSLGYESVETSASGEVLRILERQPAQSGAEIKLHLDSALQQSIYQQFKRDNRRGAAVAIEVDSGGVLAMVSVPSYDPNQLVRGISHRDYNAIVSNPHKPLLNRVLLGQYPPGSIIKPTFALSALEAKAISPTFEIDDQGYIQLEEDGRKYRDWKREGHGIMNLRQSIAQSCDIFFYELGLRTGIEALKATANKFNIGVPTGIDMPYEKKGLMPSPADKEWSNGETVNTAIGQGDLLVTPLQMAQNVAIIARKGIVIEPIMVADIDHQPIQAKQNEPIQLLEQNWNLVHSAMQDVVHHHLGTAAGLRRELKYTIASKTGTAQLVGIEQETEYDSTELLESQRDHAWFIAFAPADNPKIAIAIIVENGESSLKSAGKFAVAAINQWLDTEQTRTGLLESGR